MKITCIFLILPILLLLTHCSLVQSDTNLIIQTCKQTPKYNLCVTALNSDPKSANADVTGLAIIMVNALKNRARNTVYYIKQLLPKSPPEIKKTLRYCIDYYYDGILNADIPSALEALEKGNPKFAETGTRDAANEAAQCEDNFHGKSPITKFNTLVSDTGNVAAAITRLLL